MRLEAVWLRNDGDWRGQMRCGPFSGCVRCRRGGLEGAGRGKQKEHTVRASAIHAKIVAEPRARDEMRRKLAESGTERCDAMREMEMENQSMSMPAKGGAIGSEDA
jgi:hypothetical protein